MENSGKKRSIDLADVVGKQLRASLFPGAHVVLALSGGVDSVTLLDILARIASAIGISVRAVHVNHGISPNADAWADSCARICASLGIRLVIERADLRPWRAMGLEGAARAARYGILQRHAADALLLAHHRDDQSETLMVQLLRGAGAAGLAAMPVVRVGSVMTIRPLLGVSRREIDAYARKSGLEWVEDESNLDLSRPRNFLRNKVLPLLEEQYPGTGARLARSAEHLGEAAELLDVLAAIDLVLCSQDRALSIERLHELGEPRAKNLIRYWSRGLGFSAMATTALSELWRQVRHARPDAGPELRVGEAIYRRYRGCLYLDRYQEAPCAGFRRVWNGDNIVILPEFGGVLRFKPEEGRGLSVDRLRSGVVSVKSRSGGERLQTHPARPNRTVKNLMQEQGIPSWKRECMPLVFCGESLVSVPGVGDDCSWRALQGEQGVIVSWEPLD